MQMHAEYLHMIALFLAQFPISFHHPVKEDLVSLISISAMDAITLNQTQLILLL